MTTMYIKIHEPVKKFTYENGLWYDLNPQLTAWEDTLTTKPSRLDLMDITASQKHIKRYDLSGVRGKTTPHKSNYPFTLLNHG